MKHRATWTITSLLSILLLICHLADDVSRGFEKGGLSLLNPTPFVVLWLYGTLVLAGRRSGYIIVLLFSLLAPGVSVIHMMGKSLSRVAQSPGGFFFVWTLLAVAVTGLFSVVLSVQGLWSLARRPRALAPPVGPSSGRS
jgi:hypothetical protein